MNSAKMELLWNSLAIPCINYVLRYKMWTLLTECKKRDCKTLRTDLSNLFDGHKCNS